MAEHPRGGRRLLRTGAALAAPVLVLCGVVVGLRAGAAPEPASPVTRADAARAAGGAAKDEPGAGSTRAVARPLQPRLVELPSLGVRARVSPIHVHGGALTPPPDPREVGWWSGGSRPGASEGAAVITGHTVHTGGGSFDDLETLSRGDRVVVGSADDEVAYRVASVEVMGKAELARRSASLFSRSGPGRLVLVTCEDWDGTGYRSNVVVTARPS